MVVLTATDAGTQITGKRKTSLLKNERKLLMKNSLSFWTNFSNALYELGMTGESLSKLSKDLTATQESTQATEVRSGITSCLSIVEAMMELWDLLDTKLESLKINEELASPNTSTVDE